MICFSSHQVDGLQEMIKSCGEHARSLNLSFSTNANLIKCKPKCMASLNQERLLKKHHTRWKRFTLGENGKHLGCKIGDKICGLNDDPMEKRATYINKVNELTHEFYFVHPLTKVRINNILTPTSMVLHFGTFLVLKQYDWRSHGTCLRQ